MTNNQLVIDATAREAIAQHDGDREAAAAFCAREVERLLNRAEDYEAREFDHGRDVALGAAMRYELAAQYI